MTIQNKWPPSGLINDDTCKREANCLYALITGQRSVSRRNRASWYLRQLNKVIEPDKDELEPTQESSVGSTSSQNLLDDDSEQKDIRLVSITSTNQTASNSTSQTDGINDSKFLVSPHTRTCFLSKSIAISIILDLSPSVVSANSHNGCVFLEFMFEATKRILNLLVRAQEVPSSSNQKPFYSTPKVYVSVIAYTPFIIAKNNQVLVQNRRISITNVDQVLVEIYICLDRLLQELCELTTSACGMNLHYNSSKSRSNSTFIFPHPIGSNMIRHPGSVLEDIYELGLFSSSLMPKLSRLSMIIITDGLFVSTNNMNMFRLKSIAVSFVSLGVDMVHSEACFGYVPYNDLMRFVAKTTQGFYTTYRDLLSLSDNLIKLNTIPLLSNPIHRIFCWTLHTGFDDDNSCDTPRDSNFPRFDQNSNSEVVDIEQVARFFCVDQPVAVYQSMFGARRYESNSPIANSYHDWRSFKQLEQSLDADFEQVLSCLLREGYLIKCVQIKHKDTSRIHANLVLHWKHNLDLEQELSAPYWGESSPFEISNGSRLILRPFETPIYGDTSCEIYVHGSYSFLHNLYCDRKTRKRSEYYNIAYEQFRQLISGVSQTHNRLQYLSRFYRDSSLSKIPSFLLHGNPLLYENPSTHKLSATVENVAGEPKAREFQEYWKEISKLDTSSWTNLMHVHTLRLILEHDQPKYKNIQCQNASGRYTQVQCRRALTAISNFIKSYASFALLEDSTYIKFIDNNDDDLRAIETSATKGFIVIRISKLLPIIVINLMFTSGILDSHRVQIVSYLENQLVNCKLRTPRVSTTAQADNLIKSKTIAPSSEACCILIKSPLDGMLKVYNRNFVTDILIHNLTIGLPGSCPYNLEQLSFKVRPSIDNSEQHRSCPQTLRNNMKDLQSEQNQPTNRYNLVFGKYLYGIRVVHTLSNLPHDLAQPLASSMFSKILAVLNNLRIKQGYHIAYNSSGVLNLVVELEMQDISQELDSSSCLCQYIVFPPTVVSCPTNISSLLNCNNNQNNVKPNIAQQSRLSESLGENEGNYMRINIDESSMGGVRNDTEEIKVIKEYWIEQQYGVSAPSDAYHQSLQGLRYSEVVDHLYITDISIMDCLLTYDLLQILCDKLSPYYDLDTVLAQTESKNPKLLSPTPNYTSTSPSSPIPSTIIDGLTKDGSSRLPLLELDYKFSITKFLKFCQRASLDVLLFRDSSDYFDVTNEEKLDKVKEDSKKSIRNSDHVKPSSRSISKRKMSMDVNNSEMEHTKREHRSSYDNLSTNISNYNNSIYSLSLNHLFLDTLHKRLKQIHDKELKPSKYDLLKLSGYLKERQLSSISETNSSFHSNPSEGASIKLNRPDVDLMDINNGSRALENMRTDETIGWRCFLRKCNPENLMIVIVPASLDDITKWMDFVEPSITKSDDDMTTGSKRSRLYPCICPIFAFRCSSSMINDYVVSCMNIQNEPREDKSCIEGDLNLHFGQPCNYLNQLRISNDELNNDILPLTQFAPMLNQTTSDIKTLEIVHFRAFLRKIKNTVLKSRFSSLNDAYLSELFIHKDDILYYINNVDLDTQKKYHVSSQLKNLSEFIKNYEDYIDSLPKQPSKPVNQLLNSILLQKCGLFINQPIARFDEANPLMKQLHDRKLLFFMRCNYKVELPILEENLGDSILLKDLLSKPVAATMSSKNEIYNVSGASNNSVALSSSINEANSIISDGPTHSSLGRTESRDNFSTLRCGSLGASNHSPNAVFSDRLKNQQASPCLGSNSTLYSLSSPKNDAFILEAFKGPSCSIKEISQSFIDESFNSNIGLRHEAHMAEVLKRKGKRKESHHYRRVLKSKANYNQSHGAIDQALRRVDSLGRLEHFCLTPLLFSPSWRSKLAPVRDHTIKANFSHSNNDLTSIVDCGGCSSSIKLDNETQRQQLGQDEKWHQVICNNYIKEYEQYIQTLGFNSVQIRSSRARDQSSSDLRSSSGVGSKTASSIKKSHLQRDNNLVTSCDKNNRSTMNSANTKQQTKRNPLSNSIISLPSSSNTSTTTQNTGYLIKFLNSGCLVFKVGFCKPYVYSILYSIEGERFNNSKPNMTAFLDELDNIKVTMHLHSFTYDYHLRTMYSYISRRQMTFSPGYHLISFFDDFRKYYQKGPNYARNHLLNGEAIVNGIKVDGQQLYNYIVTHNSAYNMEVLEMNSSAPESLNKLGIRTQSKMNVINDSSGEFSAETLHQSGRNHANDYVLIQLKREKVRYRDGKDSDVFDCGLLLTHDYQQTDMNRNCLVLKYFLLLTNQRDLYPKLIHNEDNIISLGCHKPIRLGLLRQQQQQQQRQRRQQFDITVPAKASISQHQTTQLVKDFDQVEEDVTSFNNEKLVVVQQAEDDLQSSELMSSGETSEPQSIVSTLNSVRSSHSGLQFGTLNTIADNSQRAYDTDLTADDLSMNIQLSSLKLDESIEAADVLKSSIDYSNNQSSLTISQTMNKLPPETTVSSKERDQSIKSQNQQIIRVVDSTLTDDKKNPQAENATSLTNNQERAICDEEITYLGYFSSEEMDMLKFLQEKTTNLKAQIEQMVTQAEIHYRRDYLWHKLMQRNLSNSGGSGNKGSDECPLLVDELLQLLQFVEYIDLSTLDPQLSVFSTMHINWYMKLLRAFGDFKQSSSINQHRIFIVGTNKLLLLYIDPKCTTALILLTIDTEKSTVQINMVLKNKGECCKSQTNKQRTTTTAASSPTCVIPMELDQDCQQLINDFVNFCATFMWSTLLG